MGFDWDSGWARWYLEPMICKWCFNVFLCDSVLGLRASQILSWQCFRFEDAVGGHSLSGVSVVFRAILNRLIVYHSFLTIPSERPHFQHVLFVLSRDPTGLRTPFSGPSPTLDRKLKEIDVTPRQNSFCRKLLDTLQPCSSIEIVINVEVLFINDSLEQMYISMELQN